MFISLAEQEWNDKFFGVNDGPCRPEPLEWCCYCMNRFPRGEGYDCEDGICCQSYPTPTPTPGGPCCLSSDPT